jgi:hypothetical protein
MREREQHILRYFLLDSLIWYLISKFIPIVVENKKEAV